MSSFCPPPWEAPVAFLVPSGCPGRACPAPVPVGRFQQGCRSPLSSMCQLPVRPLGCLCGNRADTLNVVAKAVFSPSLNDLLQGFPAGKPYTLLFSWHGSTGANCVCSKHLSTANNTLLLCNLKAWPFWPLVCLHLLFILSVLEINTKICVRCRDEQKSC